MHRFVTIDRQGEGEEIALWTTTLTSPTGASHTNAHVFDLRDGDSLRKIRAVTAHCPVLITPHTTLDDLPPTGPILTIKHIEELVEFTEVQRSAVLAAVDDYKRRTRSKNIVAPEFAKAPRATDYLPASDEPGKRALALANFLAAAWNAWLTTEEQRLRRTVRPKTGETPWMMPDHLNSPVLAWFPPELSQLLEVEHVDA